MLDVAPIDPIAKGILANPLLTDPSKLSLSPDPPPPPPPDNGDSGDENGDDGNGDDGHPSDTVTLSQPTQSSATSTSDVTSTPTSTSSASRSSSSTAQPTSFSDSSLSASESSGSAQTISYKSIHPTIFQSETYLESAAASSTSVSTMTSLSITSIESSTGTAPPIGQDDHGLEVKAGSSPLTTAGIVLASIFGVIAIMTVIYLLYRFRRRRKVEDSLCFDNEKQLTNISTAQETGIIFGRGTSNYPRTNPNPYAQQDQQIPTNGRGYSRFSFLNRRWYSTGTQFSDSQEQAQVQRHPHQAEHQQSTTTPVNPASPQRWPSPSFFTRNFPFSHHPRPNSHLNTRTYPPASISRLPPHLHATAEINRTTSTRTNASTTSQPGSGHARAYAHHGITTPRFSVISAARTTISSISTRWLGGGRTNESENNESLPSSSFSSLAHARSSLGTSDGMISPIGSVTDHRRPSSTLLPSPLQMERSRGEIRTAMMETENREDGQRRRQSRGRERVASMPRLPLPVVVSRGSWGRGVDG